MFQDNPLLQQLKAQIRESLPTVEGTVKGTEKGFGFIETEKGESHFVPPPYMKKVMHGDKVTAVLRTEGEKTSAEPETLLEPFLTRFVARVKRIKGRVNVVPDHPLIKDAIRARVKKTVDEESLQDGDYVVAHLKRHPLRPDDNTFLAEVSELVAKTDDPHVPWWVILAKHDLAKVEPADPAQWQLADAAERTDLTELPFVTIDAESTKDMDDALYVEAKTEGGWQLTVAIADPTAYVAMGDEVDLEAKKRSFTQYLPGFNVPMLPRQLADELCSLVEGEDRPAVAARIQVAADGALEGEAEFFLATIRSQGKLAYDKVSDLLEGVEGAWQPESDAIAEQVNTLHALANARTAWRHEHALVFPDRPDYRFEVDDAGNVLAIHAEYRRTANRIVEECMILANSACGALLGAKLGKGIFNSHAGLDPEKIPAAIELLSEHGLTHCAEKVTTLEGYCQLRRDLDAQPTGYLDARIRRMQAYAEMAAEPKPHFGMGLTGYATWTSPIRKYGDMINHRLLKAIIGQPGALNELDDDLLAHLAEKRKLHRMCERDVGDWLYARYLKAQEGGEREYDAEVIDINRGGVRVRLKEIGAVAFVPAPFLCEDKKRLECSGDTGIAKFDGEPVLRVADDLTVLIAEVRVDQRNVVAKPAKRFDQ
ncbi:exoribonuclease II [Ferrimonas balearica]|uniref:exoribonuclease II n=1 Tax=Ferrimonas balearica TaxID=44012 RepID=UPI001F1A6C0D|nr:exoribonuclease II [Ferrimonas balearica]MBY6019009.1 exoribonuclease II [Halomonas denitrificans]MBY6095611.1 exoribonuclease II [Ferrimonas balearica]